MNDVRIEKSSEPLLSQQTANNNLIMITDYFLVALIAQPQTVLVVAQTLVIVFRRRGISKQTHVRTTMERYVHQMECPVMRIGWLPDHAIISPLALIALLNGLLIGISLRSLHYLDLIFYF